MHQPYSECSDRYMSKAIRSYIHRAYKTCTSEGNLKPELNRVKQILINNGFSNLQVDQEIQKYRIRKQDDSSRINKINVFYENQINKANKIDERIIKNNVSRNFQCSNVNDRLNLIIYYKNKKSKQLVIKNSFCEKRGQLLHTNVIYELGK